MRFSPEISSRAEGRRDFFMVYPDTPRESSDSCLKTGAQDGEYPKIVPFDCRERAEHPGACLGSGLRKPTTISSMNIIVEPGIDLSMLVGPFGLQPKAAKPGRAVCRTPHGIRPRTKRLRSRRLTDGAVSLGDSSRVDRLTRMHLFEMEARMPRISLKLPIGFFGLPPDLLR